MKISYMRKIINQCYIILIITFHQSKCICSLTMIKSGIFVFISEEADLNKTFKQFISNSCTTRFFIFFIAIVYSETFTAFIHINIRDTKDVTISITPLITNFYFASNLLFFVWYPLNLHFMLLQIELKFKFIPLLYEKTVYNTNCTFDFFISKFLSYY